MLVHCMFAYSQNLFPLRGFLRIFHFIFLDLQTEFEKDVNIEEMKISICFLQACFMDTNRFIQELINNSIIFEMYGKLLVFSFSF